MRGIGHTLSRLPAARVLIAGAAILAGASAPRAHAQTVSGLDETAMAIPRVLPRGPSGVSLPLPLEPSEAVRLKRIFALQARGDLSGALREINGMDVSSRLMEGMLGHVLADRHLGPYTRPDAPELQAWLDSWSDLPDASSIHTLMAGRLPNGATPPPAPRAASLPSPGTTGPGVPVPEETEPVGRALDRNRMLDRAVYDAARSGVPGAAQRLLARTAITDRGYAGQLRGEAGQILFTANRDQEAYDVASAGVYACSGQKPPCQDAALAGQIAGLAAWRMGRPDLARPMFEAAWRAEFTTSALRAGAAFWAARSHMHLLNEAAGNFWLRRAAQERNTFYGILARRTLGLALHMQQGPRETLAQADVDAVSDTPQGLRALALLQIGQTARAEAELRRLWPDAQSNPALGRAMMLVAERAGLSDLAAQLADLVQTADGLPRERTRFPVPRLQPSSGFLIDPAMIYALARTESDFNPGLVSSAGARGLMQIMPETARFIIGQNRGEGLGLQLHDPAVNLDLGQRYVSYLAGHEAVDGDLIRLLASYNSGPGGFARWGGNVRDQGDPLLFIEAVPINETRAYIPRVLAYTWIYAVRLGLPTPSLDALAAGLFPKFTGAAMKRHASATAG